MQHDAKIVCCAWVLFLLMGAGHVDAQDSPGAAASPQQARVDRDLALLAADLVEEDPQDDELRKLLKARYNAAVLELKVLHALYQNGRASVESFAEVGRRIVESGSAIREEPGARAVLLEQYVALLKAIERSTQLSLEHGIATPGDLHRARCIRLDAEIEWLRARG